MFQIKVVKDEKYVKISVYWYYQFDFRWLAKIRTRLPWIFL